MNQNIFIELIAAKQSADIDAKKAEKDFQLAGGLRRSNLRERLAASRRNAKRAGARLDNAIRQLALQHDIHLQERAELKVVLKEGEIHLYEYPDYPTGPGYYVIGRDGRLCSCQPPSQPEVRIYLA